MAHAGTSNVNTETAQTNQTTPAAVVNPDEINFRNNYESGLSLNNSQSSNNVIVSGIRIEPSNFQRRTAESSRIIRNNISLVIEEIRPYVEQARSNLLNRQTSQNSNASISNQANDSTNNGQMSPVAVLPVSETASQFYTNDYVITVDDQSPDNSVASDNSRQNSIHDRPASPNNNNNNNDDDAQAASDTLRHMPEARALLETIQKYVPFVMILLAKVLYDHREGLLNLIILFFTFMHSNSIVKQEVMQQGRRSVTSICIVLLFLAGGIILIDYLFNDERLFASLVFAAAIKRTTVWELLWSVAVNDFMLKLITVMCKAFVVLAPGFVMPFQRRGKIYLFIESISQFYRSLLPIQPWLWFLSDSYQGAERVMGVLLAAAYVVAKGADLASKLKLIKTACQKLIQNVNFGTAASKEQLRIAGEQCPICHDVFNEPVALQQCKHVFCETCVCAWLDREPTCPLCRATVADDPAWRDGSTTHHIQLY